MYTGSREYATYISISMFPYSNKAAKLFIVGIIKSLGYFLGVICSNKLCFTVQLKLVHFITIYLSVYVGLSL